MVQNSDAWQSAAMKCFFRYSGNFEYISESKILKFNYLLWFISSLITYVVCTNLIRDWRDLQFKVDSKWQIFEKLSMAIFYISSEFLPEICWNYQLRAILLCILYFDVLTWGLNSGFTSNRATLYLLNYNDNRDRFHDNKISMNAYEVAVV